MFKKFFDSYRELNKTDKSIVYFMWIFFMGNTLAGTFVNIFMYNNFGSINGILIYNLVAFSVSFIGFAIAGILLSTYSLNFKYSFKIGLLVYIISIFTLIVIGKGNYYLLYLYSILNGLGGGIFWCAVHIYELGYIEKFKRDFYSSTLSIGTSALTVFLPLIASIIFLTVKDTQIDGYNILFTIVIIIYLSCFYFIKYLPDYYPKKVGIRDILSEFNTKEKYQLLFFSTENIAIESRVVLTAIISIFLLKTEVNIGIYQCIFGLLSILVSIFLSTKRNEGNRLKIMFFFSILFLINLTYFGIHLTLLGFIISRLFALIIEPGYGISAKVYLMKYMGDLTKEHDMFLSKVIYRETILAVSRIIMFGAMLFAFNYSPLSELALIKICLVLSGVTYILSCLFVYLEEKRLKSIE